MSDEPVADIDAHIAGLRKCFDSAERLFEDISALVRTTPVEMAMGHIRACLTMLAVEIYEARKGKRP